MPGSRNAAVAVIARLPTSSSRNLRGHHEHEAATRLQRLVRAKVTCTSRFSRDKLAERLLFEGATLIGTARLVNQLFVFVLFVLALRLSSDETFKFGIFKNMQVDFNITQLKNTATREDFVQKALPLIANKSKQFSLFSSQYFDTGGLGSLELNRETTSFRDPVPGPVVQLRTQGFSMTAWIQTSRRFIGGYIVRKRPLIEGTGMEGNTIPNLACWGWYLHHRFGPQLHFGAHDFAPLAPYGTDTSARQVVVKLEAGAGGVEAGSIAMPYDEFMMLTLSVSETRVRFWRDLQLLGEVRALSCYVLCSTDAGLSSYAMCGTDSGLSFYGVCGTAAGLLSYAICGTESGIVSYAMCGTDTDLSAVSRYRSRVR